MIVGMTNEQLALRNKKQMDVQTIIAIARGHYQMAQSIYENAKSNEAMQGAKIEAALAVKHMNAACTLAEAHPRLAEHWISYLKKILVEMERTERQL